MADDITLRIDGVDWTYWTSVQVTRQMDAIAGTFSLALADKWIGGAQALPIAAGMACQILIGGEQVIDGYIDQVRPSFSATAHGISVTGRDRSADLVDCAAIHSPGQWLNCTVLQLAQALASPFGVNVTAEGDVGAPIASFKLEEGETAFEALDRALRPFAGNGICQKAVAICDVDHLYRFIFQNAGSVQQICIHSDAAHIIQFCLCYSSTVNLAFQHGDIHSAVPPACIMKLSIRRVFPI